MSGSLVNMISGTSSSYEPKVGDGATFLHWSDRSPGTITAVKGNSVWIRGDHYKVVSGSTMDGSAQYEFSPDEDAPSVEYTKRRNGQYVRKGQPMKNGSRVALGYRDAYHDPSF